MAPPSATPFALILLALVPCLLVNIPKALAQKAPAPAPPGPINLTGILNKNGQYSTFIRLLTSTRVANQIDTQLNSSDQGMTVFAPTDNAFNNLKAGTLNGLSTQQQVALVLYHVLPKYYSMVMFETVSNPVRTQASGQDGGQYGINITSSANQVNVSSGVIETQLNNAVRQEFPLAVYQVDKVLLPDDLFATKTTVSSPPPTDSPTKKSPVSSAKDPAPSGNASSGSKLRNAGLGLVIGICLMCMSIL